jgi:hypothetical protein
MSQTVSLPQSIPGSLPLFFTALAQSPRRIFWQEKPDDLSCRLVFGIPQDDGSLSPIFLSDPQTANVWKLEPLPLQPNTLYGWQIETTQQTATYGKGDVVCEGRLFLIHQDARSELARYLDNEDEAESDPMALLGLVTLLCHFGLFQEALRLTTRSLVAQPPPVRELMHDTARLVIYGAMTKRIAAQESHVPARFGEWAATMTAFYAARVEQRKQMLANAGMSARQK